MEVQFIMALKAVILAGGFGTRLSEETGVKPKPMVEIGGKPILWHIMKIYSHYGINDFIICLGYKGNLIKEFFQNYYMYQNDITISFKDNSIKLHNNSVEPWSITLIDTGQTTMTGSRIRKIKKYVGDTFLLTYGDAVADIDIHSLIKFHESHNGFITMTVVTPESRFGAVELGKDNIILQFREKYQGDSKQYVNGGFFVCGSEIFDYISGGNSIVFEREPLENLAKDGKLFAYQHNGFWKCMDTLRDKIELEELWKTNPKWRIWGE